MNDLDFENQLQAVAKGMEYPRTPEIAGVVMRRLQPVTQSRFASKPLAWSLTIIFVLLSSLMLIPPARAALLEFIQIGIVRIFPRAVEPTVEIPTTAIPEVTPAKTATPVSSDFLPVLNRLAGETSLADAVLQAGYPILLPSYPPELGVPDRVFLQDTEGKMTILVWLDPGRPDKVTLSLHFIPSGSWVIRKMGPAVIQEVSVNGKDAIWAEGPYPLTMQNGIVEFSRLIEGHVLIWSDGEITYRLETDLSLEETIKIAESLEPLR